MAGGAAPRHRALAWLNPLHRVGGGTRNNALRPFNAAPAWGSSQVRGELTAIRRARWEPPIFGYPLPNGALPRPSFAYGEKLLTLGNRTRWHTRGYQMFTFRSPSGYP
jgi:hypothetical protein